MSRQEDKEMGQDTDGLYRRSKKALDMSQKYGDKQVETLIQQSSMTSSVPQICNADG